MAWFVGLLGLIAVSAVLGARGNTWTVAVGPLLSVGVGLVAVLTEPANYDMEGFGYYLGALGAAVSVGVWIAARAASRGRRRHESDV